MKKNSVRRAHVWAHVSHVSGDEAQDVGEHRSLSELGIQGGRETVVAIQPFEFCTVYLPPTSKKRIFL